MAGHVQVQPRAVAEENIGAAAPGHHPTEQVAGHFVRAQASMTVKCAGDTEFGLDTHDSSLHNSSVLAETTTGAEPPVDSRAAMRAYPTGCDWCRLRTHP